MKSAVILPYFATCTVYYYSYSTSIDIIIQFNFRIMVECDVSKCNVNIRTL